MNGVVLALLQAVSPAAPMLVDGFERADRWTAHPADGVELRVAGDRGRTGRALRLDFSFTSGGGYAIARRAIAIPLPSNYTFSFWIKGEAPPNTLEFKLVDRSGENVWWYTERDRVFDGTWKRIIVRKRQISFAWGPRGGGAPDTVAAIEFVVTAGRGGGKGTVWLDELALTPAPELGPYDLTPRLTGTAARPGHPLSALLDGDTATSWEPATPRSTVTLDFQRNREYGGLTILWSPGREAPSYVVRISDDARHWREVARRPAGLRPRDYLYLPDTESRYLRLEVGGTNDPSGAARAGVRELRIEPLEWAASRNAFFTAVAADAERGSFPRYFRHERADWTVVGIDGAREEALLNEDGAIEAGSAGFSAEPFFRLADGHLLTWNDARSSVSLEQSRLPIPSVEWQAADAALTVTAFAVGTDTGSSVVGRYRLMNRGRTPLRGTFYVAIRPFQVNPPWQFLGTPGGVTRIDSLRWDGRSVLVNAHGAVVPIGPGAGFGAVPFGEGDIVEFLRRGALPRRTAVRDPFGAASGALAWPVTLAPGESTTRAIEIPLGSGRASRLRAVGQHVVDRALADAVTRWSTTLDRSVIRLPPSGSHVANTIASTIGYILVNRDGPALQPGSRSYERSWIRDGALTGAALLRFGHTKVVRDFILWYAGFQYPNGKIPCCVDRRGADPVPEHDSHGEFIYLVMEYFRHTGDRALLEQLWPRVQAAVAYLDSLRQTRRTSEYRTPGNRVFFGLLPPSISHEGYSAKPMHSYWDDFFALRGFKDAVAMAGVLGRRQEAERIAAIRDEFSGDLYTSIDEALRRHAIDFIPGAADLGDFDATSTTIAVSPGGELERLPRAALNRTFERYWEQAAARRDSAARWEAYTPYELRAVGTLLRMGWKDRALELLDGFMADQEPPAWNQWPEVVWHQPRAPRFIGDLPHTWVGSDFLRSVADLFVYEREADSTLVLGAGIPDAWLADSGVTVRGLSTWWGPLSYTARREENAVTVTIDGGLRPPPGGILLLPPGSGPVARATVDGRDAILRPDGGVLLYAVPARIRFQR
jgi:hypothetical protein